MSVIPPKVAFDSRSNGNFRQLMCLKSNLKIKLVLFCIFTASCAAGLLSFLGSPFGLPVVAAFIVPGARELVTTSSHPLVRFFTEPQVAAVTPEGCDIGPKVYVSNLRSNSVSVIDVSEDEVIATIPVGRNPFAIAITPDCTKAYVGNLGSFSTEENTVSVIDVSEDEVIATITVGLNPGAIAITPDGSKVYVANSGISSSDNTVSVIDVEKSVIDPDNAVITTITVGIRPGAIAITPDGSKAYVTNSLSSTVSVIDVSQDNVIKTINVGLRPAGIAITPNGSRAYVANNFSDTVSVINTSANNVITEIDVGVEPLVVAVTPNGSKVYVANLSSNSVSVINVHSNEVRTIPVGSIPVAIGITPNGSKAYVGNCNCGIADPNNTDTVSVIDVAMDIVIDEVEVGFGPLGLTITPDGTKVYVPNSNSSTVSVIDTTANMVIKEVNVGSGPAFVVITPDNKKVYVSSYENPDHPGNTVSVIDTVGNTVIGEITVGLGPTGMAVTPDGKKLYVANFGSISDPGNTVSVIDVETDTVMDTVELECTVDTAEVPCGPISIAITPDPDGPDGSDNPKAYVASFGSSIVLGSTVSVIDTGTDEVVDIIDVGTGPAGVAVAPDGSKVYVTNLGGVGEAGDTVSAIDVAIGTVTPITVGDGPLGIAITQDAGTPIAFAANFSSITSSTNFAPGNTVSVIDVVMDEIVSTVPVTSGDVGFGPAGIAATPDGSKIYVSIFDNVEFGFISNISNPGNTLSVIDVEKSVTDPDNAVIATITVGNRPLGVAVTHNGTDVDPATLDRAYAANYFSNTISVIDTEADTPIDIDPATPGIDSIPIE